MNFLIGCCEKAHSHLAHSNARASGVTHVRTSQTPFQFLAQRTPPKSPIISTALPAMSSIAYGAPPLTSFTSAKQDEGWEIVSANIFWM